jgi:hypothetical protein
MRAEQERRRKALVGKVLVEWSVTNLEYEVILKFSDGSHLRVSLSGGELDGHSDPPANRNLRAEVLAPGEKTR